MKKYRPNALFTLPWSITSEAKRGQRIRRMLVEFVGLVMTLTAAACSSGFNQWDESAGSRKCEARWFDSASENSRCYEIQKQLSEAAIVGDLLRVKDSIENGANVNGGYDESVPLLELASSKGNTDVVRILIEAGASVNRVRPLGQTALKSAVYHGHVKTVKALLESSADVCEKTESSALQYAIEAGNHAIVNLLVEVGADECPREDK